MKDGMFFGILCHEIRKEIFDEGGGTGIRKEARRKTMERWQEKWKNSSKESWTRRLIGDINLWIRCGHKKMSYFMTEAFTGHGSFMGYTRRIGKYEVDDCPYCATQDTAEHTIFHCLRWKEEKDTTIKDLGIEKLTPENSLHHAY